MLEWVATSFSSKALGMNENDLWGSCSSREGEKRSSIHNSQGPTCHLVTFCSCYSGPDTVWTINDDLSNTFGKWVTIVSRQIHEKLSWNIFAPYLFSFPFLFLNKGYVVYFHFWHKPVLCKCVLFFLLSLYFWPHSMQDFSSSTRDWTLVPCSGRLES